jgi:large subunit ribosomal protein L32e
MSDEKASAEVQTKAARPPQLSPDEKKLLTVRRIQKSGKPEFRRQESWRYRRVHSNWRRPKGIDSKMRLKLGGRPKSVEIGYGSPSQIRGRNAAGHDEVIVFNIGDMSKVALTQVIRIAHVVGKRKRAEIIEKARSLGLYIVNPGSVDEVES